MAYRSRVVDGYGPQIGHEVRVYRAGTRTLVEGLVRPGAAAEPLTNPFTIQEEIWGFETPRSLRVDIVANGKMLWPDVNVYQIGRDVGHGPLKIPRYDIQGRLPGVGTMLRYANGILQWKYEMEDETKWRNLVYIPVDIDGMQVTNYQPQNYFPQLNIIDSHLQGIDERLGVIVHATDGISGGGSGLPLVDSTNLHSPGINPHTSVMAVSIISDPPNVVGYDGAAAIGGNASGGKVQFYYMDGDQWALQGHTITNPPSTVRGVALHEDGDFVAVCASNLWVYTFPDGTLQQQIDNASWVVHVAWMGDYLIAASTQGPHIRVYVRDNLTLVPLDPPIALTTTSGTSKIDTWGPYFAVGGGGGPGVHAFRLDSTSGAFIAVSVTGSTPNGWGGPLAWHPSGDYLVVSHAVNGSTFLSLFSREGDALTYLREADEAPSSEGYVTAVAWMGNYLLVGSDWGDFVSVFELVDGHLVKRHTVPEFNDMPNEMENWRNKIVVGGYHTPSLHVLKPA